MADITITAANVKKGTGAQTQEGTAGESITAGMPVYLKSSDSKLYKADANVTSAEAAIVRVALHVASADQPLIYQTSGPLTIGGTVVAGTAYYVSATAGGICPFADLSSTNYASQVGVATSTSVLQVRLYATGATLA